MCQCRHWGKKGKKRLSERCTDLSLVGALGVGLEEQGNLGNGKPLITPTRRGGGLKIRRNFQKVHFQLGKGRKENFAERSLGWDVVMIIEENNRKGGGKEGTRTKETL